MTGRCEQIGSPDFNDLPPAVPLSAKFLPLRGRVVHISCLVILCGQFYSCRCNKISEHTPRLNCCSGYHSIARPPHLLLPSTHHSRN